MPRLPIKTLICLTFKHMLILATLIYILLSAGGKSISAYLSTQTDLPELKVTASFADQVSITPDAQLELFFNRPINTAEGSISIFLAETDITGLFNRTDNGLRYSRTIPLPLGNRELIVYLVSANDEWRELLRLPLQVASSTRQDNGMANPVPNKKRGLEKAEFIPSLTLNIKSQAAEGHFPDTIRPDRPTFVDLTMQSSLRTDLLHNGMNFQTQFDFVGASFQRDALRFGEKGTDALQIDLSSYFLQFQQRKAKLQIGHISYGSIRHLVNSFSSRGITLSLPLNRFLDLSFAAMNGTSIVGFNNFAGLGNRKHQVVSGSLGLEFFPRRAGALRLETSILKGSLLPLSSFTQSNVNDRERSQGWGLRLLASDAAQRLRAEGGFTRSRFINPPDRLLNQGLNTVQVRETTRDAHYLDLSYDILKERALTTDLKTNLRAAFREERVAPLFRSVAASPQADRFQTQWELSGNLGELLATASHTRANDNLGNIPSILKTLTRNSSLNLSAPLTMLLGKNSALTKFAPRLSYSYDRFRQLAAFRPVNGGFDDPSTLPDQLSTNQSFAVDWQFPQLRVGYRLGNSLQDNRQLGRAQADFRTITNAITLGWTPISKLDLNFDINADSVRNREIDQINRTTRFGLNLNLRPTDKTAFIATLSTTGIGDTRKMMMNRSGDLNLEFSWRFGLEKDRLRKVQGQFFIRYANQFTRNRDNILGFNTLTKSWTLNTGTSFTFF